MITPLDGIQYTAEFTRPLCHGCTLMLHPYNRLDPPTISPHRDHNIRYYTELFSSAVQDWQASRESQPAALCHWLLLLLLTLNKEYRLS